MYRERFRKQWSNKLKGRAYHRDLAEARIVECPDDTLVGLTFAEVAVRRGRDRIDTFLDLQAEFGNDLRWTTTVGNTNEESVAWIVNHPQAQIGFSDAGAHLRNMAFYNMGLRLLKRVRDAEQAGRPFMSVETAVHRLTGELADWFGLDAGHLRVGDRADLVIIDPTRLDDTVDAFSEEPAAQYDGMVRMVNRNDATVNAVLISGRTVVADGTPTALLGTERTGSFLRAGRQSPAVPAPTKQPAHA